MIDTTIQQKISRRRFMEDCAAVAGILGATALAGCATRSAGSPLAEQILCAGVAKQRITPPIWIPYLTSSANGTSALFQGVHDALFARALVLDDGTQSIAILTADSIGYDNSLLGPGRDFTNEVRQRVASKTGLRPESIMVASTHAHSTPETICLSDLRKTAGVEAWLEEQVKVLSNTLIQAWRNRVRVNAFFGAAKVEGIARNRRILLRDGKLSRSGPLPTAEKIAMPGVVDEDLSVLHFKKRDGRPHAVLLNYAAHPVVAMLLPHVSADYPGAAAAEVEKSFPGATCLFTNGAAGNVNTVSVSTNFDDVQRIGQRLGRAAIEEIRRSKPAMEEASIQCCSEFVELESRKCPSVYEAEQTAKFNPSFATDRILRLALKIAEGPISAEVQLMRVGPLKIISIPGEAFVETGLVLKKSGAAVVIGYANGWVGYLPIRRAYAEGGYEVEMGAWSRVAPGSAERIEEVGQKLLNKSLT